MSEYGKFYDQLHGISSLIDKVTRVLDDTWLNKQASYFASIPNALLHHSTPTHLGVLDNDYHIPAPDTEYQAEHSPTLKQFYEAAVAEASLNSDAPEGLEPFEINGRQVELVDLVSGTSARVWQSTEDQQLIVAFSFSTGGDTALTNPLQVPGQLISNVPPAAGIVSAGQEDAVAFTSYIAEVANERGISSDDIFVTGHSLGASLAQYVAQQTGLGGIAFAGQGVLPSDDAVGDGSNFINVLTYGDPWATLSSDVEGTQPIAADFDLENGNHPHWGSVVMLGNVDEQQELQDSFDKPFHDNVLFYLEKFIERTFSFHLPGNQGADLGFERSGGIFANAGTHQHGQVFDAGDLTIAETLAANEKRTDYHDVTLPSSESDAQSVLAEAIAANVSDDALADALPELDGAELESAQADVAAAIANVVGVAGAEEGVQLDAVA